MHTLSTKFAAALLSGRTLSDSVTDKAKYCLLDYLASAYSTQQFHWVINARDMVLQNSGMDNGGAALIGSGKRASLQDAAFVNAVAGHSLVRDDMHLGSVAHLGVVVIPPALALAENRSVSGETLLEAIVAGYEAGGKLGRMLMDVQTAKKIRPTGLIGAWAAAATGSVLLGMDEEQASNALGLASNYFIGLNEWAAWGSEDMYFHPGIAVRNGMTAVMLALQGAKAAATALEGKAGLFAALGKHLPKNPLLPFSDKTEIEQVFFKQVPACNYAQTAAQVAALAVADKQVTPDKIKHINIKVPYAAAHYPGCDFAGPFSSILHARMSIQFNVASAIINDDFEDSHYQNFTNKNIASLARKVVVDVDAELTDKYPTRQGAAVTIQYEDQCINAALDDVIPASIKEVNARFLASAAAYHGQERAVSIQKKTKTLDTIQDLTEYLRLLD